ncbi:MAG: UDP-N-acetylmuramate dehydrogenase [Aminivibrio sp.]|jgi:UDP-N-acetylmuramate dehydrogenase
MTLAEKLHQLSVGFLSPMEPLKNHCSWRIGGPADVLVQPSVPEEVLRLLRFVREEGVPMLTIGRGSNLLFSDGGFRGVVMKLGRHFSSLSFSGTKATAQSGIWVPAMARALAGAGLSGFEHAAGIPGSLGGLIVMNGGSLRRAVGENIRFVDAVSPAGELRRFQKDECGFSYRRSVFQDGQPKEGWIILGASMNFDRSDRQTVRRGHLEVLRERRGKFPLKLPNCGSVFTNDPAVYELAGPPGKIVEDAGLKGLTVGGAQVSPLHANFIVNLGGASSEDVLELIGLIRRRVFERLGLWLACEVRYVDEKGLVAPASEACPGGGEGQ